MIAAAHAVQRPTDARLLAIDERGFLRHLPRSRFAELLTPGDVVIANDAATLPASLAGLHLRTGREIEVRLAGRGSLAPDDVHRFRAVIFGEGDYRTPTEHRPMPPALNPGDILQLGPLRATVSSLLGHARLTEVAFEGSADEIWAGLARHGHPIQYSHVREHLHLWDVWSPVAGPPVAFEPPSAGFVLDWRTLASIRNRGAAFSTITHAAGISSTGDAELDARLPFDEPWYIPARTAALIENARRNRQRIIAVGTTVVRALEDAGSSGKVQPGSGVATGRIGRESRLQIVNALLSGTHEPGTSHYELLRAFIDDSTLERATRELNAYGYRTHEFGDSLFIATAFRSSGVQGTPLRRGSALGEPDTQAGFCAQRGARVLLPL